MNNRKHVIIFLILLCISVGSYGWLKKNEHINNTRLFKQIDTSQLVSMAFLHRKDSFSLQRAAPHWQINNRDEADPFVLGSLLEILHRAQSRQQLTGAELTRINANMQEKGVRVHITLRTGKNHAFTIWGNKQNRRSYVLLPNDELHEFIIFGHAGYLASLFFLKEIQWHLRRIFHSNVYTLQKIILQYPQHPTKNLHIHVQEQQPKITGVSHVDTMRLYTYLAQYENFYTNEYIEKGQVPHYDSLLAETPFAHLRLQDIHAPMSRHVTIYMREADNYFLLQENGKEPSLSLCKKRRFLPFLRSSSFFLQKNRQP